jgi:Flp pilus assembly pilin Flp
MCPMFKRFRDADAGATSIEYGLIGVLISIFIIVAVTGAAGQISALFNKVDTTMSSATSKSK